MNKIKNTIEKFKYPIIVLSIGLVLMLLPGASDNSPSGTDADALLSHILSCTDGVGEARVIVSEKGVVVVCSGADNAKVRLEIFEAVGSYTGFASDRITVLKMADAN